MIGTTSSSVPNSANLAAVADTATMTRREAAVYLGVSVKTVDLLRRRGELTTLRNASTHHVRIPQRDVWSLKYIRDEYVPTRQAG